jgi:lipoprotein-releasing system permease protein
MQLPVELFLALRYLRPHRSFVSIISILSFLGVALAVLALIVVLSVMAGFQAQLADKIVGFNAHITVGMADGGLLYDYDKALDLVRKQPGVVAATPFIRGAVLIRFHGRESYAFIKSMPVDGDDPVVPLKKSLKLGDYELRGDSVLVGSEWCKRNGAFPGDKIEIFGPIFMNAISDMKPGDPAPKTFPLPEEPIIRGIYETGRFDFDSEFVVVSLEKAQELWGMQDAVHGIAVRVKDLDQAVVVKDELNRNLPPTLHARTWMDDNQELISAIGTERVVMACILFLIMIVAALGLCSTLITTTVQKSREIGLMKALGANDFQVCGVFLLNGLVIGILGSVGGTMAGLLLLHFRNPFRDFLLHTFHIQVFAGSVYGLPEIPAVIDPFIVSAIALSAVIICVLAALLPAISAATLAPARALRYE